MLFDFIAITASIFFKVAMAGIIKSVNSKQFLFCAPLY